MWILSNALKWLHITYEVLDVLLVYDVIRSEPRGHAEKKKIEQLVASKTCRPYLFQMTCSADRP